MPKPSSSIHTHAHASPIPRDKTSQLGETYLESPLGETYLEHECQLDKPRQADPSLRQALQPLKFARDPYQVPVNLT